MAGQGTQVRGQSQANEAAAGAAGCLSDEGRPCSGQGTSAVALSLREGCGFGPLQGL